MNDSSLFTGSQVSRNGLMTERTSPKSQEQKKKPVTAKFDDESNCNFQPKINPVSELLVKKRKEEIPNAGKAKWDQLYELNEKKRIEDEEKRQYMEAEKL